MKRTVPVFLASRRDDGLCRDDAGSFAEFDEAPRGQVAPVAHHANAALRFAGQHGADLHPLDAGGLDRAGQFLGDFLVDVDDGVAVVVLDLLERHAADDTVTQRLDDLAGFHDTGDVDAVDGAAVVFADDHVLGDVDQAARQVARVRRLERGIGQTLAGTVGRDEVFEHRQPFTEVRRDGRLDDLAGRFRHQAAHSGELADLLFRSAGAGVGHDVNRVDIAFLVLFLHLAEHLVRDLFGNRRPDFDDLVVALAIGNGAVQVLLLDVDALLLGIANQGLLVVRHDHVVDTDRETRAGRKVESERLDLVKHLDGDFQAKAQVAVVHQLANALLLEQPVDVRHALGQVIVQDRPAYGRVQEAALVVDFVGVRDVLIVVRGGQVDHFTSEAETDRGQGLDLAHFQREQHFFNVRERTAFALR